MTNKPSTRTALSEGLIMDAALTPMSGTEQAELLDHIERLQAVLYRFIPLLDSQSIETVTQAQAALENIRAEIDRVFAVSNTRNSQVQLQNWENEGGRIAFVPG